MTHHLSPEEFVDALDGTLEATRRAHLDGCAQCRDEIVQSGAVLERVAPAGTVPPPSPLYWEHMARRVREATVTAPRTSVPRWTAWWRPLAALAGVVGLALVVAVWRTPGLRPPVATRAAISTTPAGATRSATVGVPDAAGSDGDASWDAVMDMAADMPLEDLRQASAPMPGNADVLAVHLTGAERTRLIELLKAEMGGTE